MRQVLFRIPFPWFFPDGIPVYGFGLMLFLAFVLTTWLASRRAEKAGVSKDRLQDLAIWTFVGGLLGARIVYMIQYHGTILSWEFFKIWEGGIVFYGSLVGGAIGFTLAYYWIFRKLQVPWLRLADIIAPSLALGLALGRIGCFLNGCCFGNVACPDCPAVHFPLSAAPRGDLVRDGYQTTAGFAMMDERTVDRIVKDSAAEKSGLQRGDVIVKARDETSKVDSRLFHRAPEILSYLFKRVGGKDDVTLTVERAGKEMDLKPYAPPLDLDFHMVDDRTVAAVEPDAAKASGLHAGDVIVKADDNPTSDFQKLENYLVHNWPRGKNELALTVERDGQEVALPAYVPRTIGLHPTQLYETISMTLLFLLIIAYHPFRWRDGEVIVIFLLLYPIHRFLNEMLRNDTEPVLRQLTLSQTGSILVFLVALVLAVWLWRQPVQYPKPQPA